MKFRCLCLLEQHVVIFCTKLLEKCIDCLGLIKYSLLFSCEVFMLRSTSSFSFSRDDFAFLHCTYYYIDSKRGCSSPTICFLYRTFARFRQPSSVDACACGCKAVIIHPFKRRVLELYMYWHASTELVLFCGQWKRSCNAVGWQYAASTVD